MLHESYADAGMNLADEMVFLFLHPLNTSVTSKLVTAMFNLKEIEGTIQYHMTKRSEIEKYADKSVVHILLSPVANDDLADDDELDHYIQSIINVCKVNRRLKYAFFLYTLVQEEALLEYEMGKKAVNALKKISSKISELYS